MRSEFVIWFEKRHGKQPHSMAGDYANYTYLKHEAEKAWNHRQTEVDELQKRVDAVVSEIEKLHLSGVIGWGTVKRLEQALKGEG
ncbi:hypothetical protein AWW72_13270 [Acinetobacter sp. NRRL B-65365]|uniref:hypothetical protein n=1 Tax=Acinetobacter sp. NRRL B-65365 TaxID=1785092 RepID=UPI0007A0755D|nr:hypothetical protein [Acinetobacter sp. NRRL B-65365]KYQ83553.1 hypothetical protein AWW72_13270 [Acinetobacter sp. NRRL B-65365]